MAGLPSGQAPITGRDFIRHGAVMTVLGRLSGFTPLFAKVPTAALGAHTIGVV